MTANNLVARSVGLLLAFSFAGGVAEAQLGTAAQKCIDTYNNKLRLVAQQKGKDNRACIKNAGKGLEPAPDTCVDTVGTKTQSKIDKVIGLYVSKCSGGEPIQQGAATGSSAHVDAVDDFMHDLFGDPISGVVSPGAAEARCQDRTVKRANKFFVEEVKGFRKCKKDGMRAGTVTNSATLEAQCLTPAIPDPNGKIGKKRQDLLAEVQGSCGALAFAPIFPGLDSGCFIHNGALQTCIEQRVECRVCEALNQADGTARDCDLFDDGVDNDSCGPVGPVHKCVIDTSNCSPANNPACGSKIRLHIAAILVPLEFATSGALDIGATAGTASCTIQTFDPVNIPCIGYLCVAPGGPCSDGPRHCGPGAGPPLGVDVQSDGDTGPCASNAACQTICTGTCGSDIVLAAQCTAHCSSGAGSACTSDAQCNGLGEGNCNGPDPVAPAQANICQCTCLDNAAHGPSDPGDLQCNLSANIMIETTAPCDGTDITVNVGNTCIPVTTQRSTASITDANFIPGSTIPQPLTFNDLSGTPLSCSTLDTSTTTGLQLVGAMNFFGSTLGDISLGLIETCQ